MLKVNREYRTWDELVELYPYKWVVVEDAKLSYGGAIASGYLIGVCEDTEVDDFIKSCYDAGKYIKYARTIEGGWAGFI